MSTLTLRSMVAQTLRASYATRPTLPVVAGSALLALSFAGNASAQQAAAAAAPSNTLDEIVVTGTYQKSIIDSIEEKRIATSIVEVVSAEDIGKLPDSSIAEAIARLPGVAGQRLDGRMNSISVRGFGEDFSATTFNGREQVTIGDNRSVSFDLYPSDLVSGVKIYKTSDASVMATGIGGTIDLMGVKPLEAKEGAHLNADYEKNSFDKLSAQAKNTGYRANGSYIGHFADGKVGVAIAVSLMDSPNQEQRWQAWGYSNVNATKSDGVTPDPLAGDYILGGAKPFVRSSDLKRNSVMAVLEAAPTDKLKLTVDALFIKYDDQKILKGIEMPGANWGGAYTALTAVDGFVTSGTWDNHTLQVRNDFERETADLKSIGFNAKYEINDTWTSAFDASHGQVSRDIFSMESYAGVGRCNDPARPLDTIGFQMGTGNKGAVFTPSLNYADPNLIHLGGAECWGNGSTVPSNAQDGFVNFPHIDDKLSTFKVTANAAINGDFFKSVDLGVNYTDRTKAKADHGVFLTLPNYPAVDAVPAGYALPATSLAFIGMGNMLSYDSYALFKSGYYTQTSENLTVANRSLNTWSVMEKVLTGFVKANFATTLGEVGLTGNFGLQFVKTDQSSDGYAATNKADGTVFATPVSSGDKYNNVLPSLNAIFALTPEQQLRFGLARTLSRSRMDRMNASYGYSFNTANNVVGADLTHSPWSGTFSNTALKPQIADQVDLNYSYYFRKDGFVSAGAFYKKLKDWQVQNGTVVDFTSFTPPGGQVATFNQGYANQWVNSTSSGHVNGVELQANVPFGAITPVLEGFGFAGSATYLNSSVSWQGGTITVPGLSKRVYNSTIYFEKAGFSARVSNNSRSDYLGEVNGVSFVPQLVEVRGDHLWDAQLSYDFSQSGVSSLSGLTIALQAQNLSNAPFTTYNNGDPRQVKDYQNFGRDYLLGFRYKF